MSQLAQANSFLDFLAPVGARRVWLAQDWFIMLIASGMRVTCIWKMGETVRLATTVLGLSEGAKPTRDYKGTNRTRTNSP